MRYVFVYTSSMSFLNSNQNYKPHLRSGSVLTDCVEHYKVSIERYFSQMAAKGRLIDGVVRKALSSGLNDENIQTLCSDLNVQHVKASILKKPKGWEKDAVILLLELENNRKVCLKLHEDTYPAASHIYNQPALLKKIHETGHMSRVFCSSSIPIKNNHIRSVLYEFVEGQPLDTLVYMANPQALEHYRSLVREAFSKILLAGGNFFLGDSGDWIYQKASQGKPARVVGTDWNAVFDVSRSHTYSRNLDFVINTVVNLKVKSTTPPHTSIRPTHI